MMRMMAFPGRRMTAIAGFMPGLIEFGLVIALAWTVAGIVLQPGQTPVSAPDKQKEQAPGTDTAVSIKSLLSVDLFGKQQTKRHIIRKQVRKPPVAVPTHRSILLLGTVVAGVQSAALLIPERGKKQDVYYIGDSILPGVVLKRVESQRIVIEANGKLEVVMLAGMKNTITSLPHRSAAPAVRGGKRSLSRRVLDRELNNFSRLLSQARVSPAMQDGKSIGFRLTEIVPGSLYARVGLHNGDVVRSVNGIRIQNPSQAMAMYRQLRGERHIEIQLLRNGREQTFSYEIQ